MKAIWHALSPERRGIALFCLAMFFFTLMDVVAKELMTRHNSMQVVWASYTSQFFWTLLIFAPRITRIMRTRHLGLQLIRSAFLFGGTFCFFLSLRYLKLAEATAIFDVSPLIIVVLSVFVLEEKVGPRRWIGVAVGLIGAMIIIRPGSEVFTPASLLPMAAACCFAGYAISTRFLGNDEPAATSFVYTTLIGTIAASLIVPFYWETPQGLDIPVMATFGIIAAIGHGLLIYALSLAPASAVAPFSYVGIVLSVIWGYLFFYEVPDIFTFYGAFVIVASGLYVWHRENQADTQNS